MPVRTRVVAIAPVYRSGETPPPRLARSGMHPIPELRHDPQAVVDAVPARRRPRLATRDGAGGAAGGPVGRRPGHGRRVAPVPGPRPALDRGRARSPLRRTP